jgi:hypothetical protein
MYLDGASANYMTLPAMNYGKFDGLTITLWFKYDGGTDTWVRIFSSSDTSDSENLFVISRWKATSHIRFTMQKGKSGTSSAGGIMVENVWETGVWRHLVWSVEKTSDSSSKWLIYIDGRLASETSGHDYPVNADVASTYIGKSHGNDANFQGWIDSLRIFGRRVTKQEALSLYNEPWVWEEESASSNVYENWSAKSGDSDPNFSTALWESAVRQENSGLWWDGNDAAPWQSWCSTGCSNVALGKMATAGFAPNYKYGSNVINPTITDGLTIQSEYSDGGGLDTVGKWVQVDLGKVFTLRSVKFWSYYETTRERSYKGQKIRLSNYSSSSPGVDVFYCQKYGDCGIATSSGLTANFADTPARFVRYYQEANNVNGYRHFIELQAFECIKDDSMCPVGTFTQLDRDTPRCEARDCAKWGCSTGQYRSACSNSMPGKFRV